ncbi:MAG: DUF1302 family protein [Deltaproteobacteria bacterium]|nr:DUF1302 family protein [Deltaproteobacteria bacterium]
MREAISFSKFRCVFSKRLIAYLGMVFMIALFTGQAQAFMFKTANTDLKIHFDNTLTYSLMNRLSDQDSDLIASINSDDGNRNFDKGIVMNRMDLFSEFDISYNKFGVRFSGAAWYDTVYNKENDNDSEATVNQTSVAYNEFTDDTVKMHGKNAELMDAFTFGSTYLGESQLTYKIGQYGLWWGTSFFFGDNGIAGGMGPNNLAKGPTMPNMMMRDLLLPVPQATANLQFPNGMSLGAFYQFKWEPNRFFGVGSYFSPVDIFDNDGGGDRIITGLPTNFTRNKSKDLEADDSGQYGLEVLYASTFGVDFGAYYLRYHDKMPQIYTEMLAPPVMGPPTMGDYYLVYAENIQAYGASANATLGIWTAALELTYRTNVPLKSGDLMLAIFAGDTADNDENPLYAVGKTFHANLNFFNPGLPSSALYDSADLIFEIGYNKRMSVTKNEDVLDLTKEKYGLRTKVVFEPKWFQFLPAFDLTMPMGVEYAPTGNSSVMDTGVNKGGSWNIGLNGTYNNLWNVALTYMNYYGDTDYQSHADRDYVGLTLRRAF